MSDWGTLRTLVKQRLGLGSGTVYDTRANAAMTAAGELLHSVRWDAIRKQETVLIATGATYSNDTIADYGTLDEKNVYIKTAAGTTYSRIIRGDFSSIVINPPATPGQPLKFMPANGLIYAGCPTADADYTLKFGYWSKFVTPAADITTPEIVTALGDALFIAASVWTFAKFFEVEEENHIVSGDALQELIAQARAAEKRSGHQGPKLEEIIKAQ